MKTKPKTNFQRLLIAFTLIISNLNHLQGQSSEETLTKSFDQAIGKENLDINNGIIHINEYRILNNKHRYYPNDKFEIGFVTYNNQNYYDIPLKYDIHKDILIYRPLESDAISIELIQKNVAAFNINNKKFVYLNNFYFSIIKLKPGYYEETISGKNFTFYIRHHRSKREVLKGSSVFYEFDNDYEYFIEKNGAFNKVSSKKDLIKLFPQYKRKISDFYSSSKKMLKSDESLFYEKMMNYLNNEMVNNPSN